MAYYSIVVFAHHPVGIPDPLILLDKGLNPFTVMTDDIEGLLKMLGDEGVDIREVNCLDAHDPGDPSSLLLPDEVPDRLLKT